MISYAQNFEDVILWRALKDVSPGFYIDIGAQDPVIDSVSRWFYEAGWRGVHVEPSPHYAAKLRRDRPGEEVLEWVVGRSEGEIQFFNFPGTGLSTGVVEIAHGHEAAGYRGELISAQLKTTAQLLENYVGREIHWMKIDCEGMEPDIVEGWRASPVRPWIVVVESVLPSTQTPSYEQWEIGLLDLGYDFVYSDVLNRFYVSHQQSHLKAVFGPGPNCFDHFLSAPFNMALRNGEREIAAQRSAIIELDARRDHTIGILTREDTAMLQSMDARIVEVLKQSDQIRAERILLTSFYESKINDMQAMLILERERASDMRRLSDLLEQQSARTAAGGWELRSQLEQAQSELAVSRAIADHWHRAARSILDSTSWRITEPVRRLKMAAAHFMRRLRGRNLTMAAEVQNNGEDPALANHASANRNARPAGLRQLFEQTPEGSKSSVFIRANQVFAELNGFAIPDGGPQPKAR